MTEDELKYSIFSSIFIFPVTPRNFTFPDKTGTLALLDDISGGSIPTGLITMWYGFIATIPSGWVICDGQNGTPDLRNRFIVGAGDGYAVGATGGSDTVTLTENQMPSHTHIQNAHPHGTVTDGGTTVANGAGNAFATTTQSGATGNVAVANATATNQNTGGGAAHENRPPYYALAYIMKT